MRLTVPTPQAMEALGRELAGGALPGTQIHLSGELGAGKTTLVRGFLKGLGYTAKVKSPAYTLVEPYELGPLSLFHFDFYRITSPEEVEAMGFREYPGEGTICLIEWPENAGDAIGTADLSIKIHYYADGRIIELLALTVKGNSLINKIPSLNFS